jgi:hypothetical protein
MTDRPLPAIAPTGHLDIRKIHRSTDADEAVFSPSEIKSARRHPDFVRQHLAVGRANLQQPNEKKTYREIMFEYQAVMSIVERTHKGPGIGIGAP